MPSTRTTKFLDFLELAQDPVFYLKFKLYMEHWEAENSSTSNQLLDIIDKFIKLTSIIDRDKLND